ncbi:MAG: aldehyde dehydrogenase family protein [Rhodocyclaceae bacterium]
MAWCLVRAGFGGRIRATRPQVDAITFTGETRTGRGHHEGRGHRLAPGVAGDGRQEPGHRVCRLLISDAAIEGTMRSVFANCGQVCLGTEQVYVERPIFDRFVAALKAGAEGLRMGRRTSRTPVLAR